MLFLTILYHISQTETYFYIAQARNRCVTPCPKLVTDSEKYVRSLDFYNKKSHNWCVVLRRNSLRAHGIFLSKLTRKPEKDLQLSLTLKYDRVEKLFFLEFFKLFLTLVRSSPEDCCFSER